VTQHGISSAIYYKAKHGGLEVLGLVPVKEMVL
jgi:hypothetical protein